MLERSLQPLGYLRGLKATQFAGSEDRRIVMKLSIGTLSFSGLDYLDGFCLPSILFQYTTFCGIAVLGWERWISRAPYPVWR